MVFKGLNTKNFLIFGGVGILGIGLAPSAQAQFDTGVIDWAIGELCGHLSGNLGGLLAAVAGVGAIVAAAMGSYRVFYGALMTAVGAFAVSSIMSLYFPEAAAICNTGAQANAGGGGANARVVAAPARTNNNAAIAAGEKAAARVSIGDDPFGDGDKF